MKNKKISPLWRKENKTSLQSCSVMDSGSDYKYTRNTKHEKDSNKFRGKMSTKSYSRDWTPLFKYLLKSIGKDWNDVYLEIKDRILPLPNKKKNPIDLMVIKDAYIGNDNNLYSISEQCPMFNSTGFVSSVFRCGEATYYSKLYIDKNNILQKVSDINQEGDLKVNVNCKCHTHSYNGKTFTDTIKI